MNDYFFTYYGNVLDGLHNIQVTGIDGGLHSVHEGLSLWAERAKKVRDERHGMIFFCGNGASATMAEHMSSDWFQNAKVNTYTCSETAHLTAVSNDFSYEDVFSYRINRVLTERDMLVAISSSGNSPNIVKALRTAKEKDVFCITLTGMGEDNFARKLGNLNFYVPLATYGFVESVHSVLLHAALDFFLDKYMGGKH